MQYVGRLARGLAFGLGILAGSNCAKPVPFDNTYVGEIEGSMVTASAAGTRLANKSFDTTKYRIECKKCALTNRGTYDLTATLEGQRNYTIAVICPSEDGKDTKRNLYKGMQMVLLGDPVCGDLDKVPVERLIGAALEKTIRDGTPRK